MAATTTSQPVRAWIQAPIFILGCHKSGASLLRSLLDGHPDLFVYPHEPHFFQLAGYGVDYALRRSSAKDMPHGEMVEKMVHELQRQNAATDPSSELKNFGGYDVGTFSEAMLYAAWNNARELFELYHGALFEALEGASPEPGTRIVEKSVEHAEYAAVLAGMFPAARFLHIVRNPYATLLGMRRMKIHEKKYPYMGPSAKSLYSNVYHLFRNRKTLANYYTVRYEDLVREPERTMRLVAGFLEIPFVPKLLNPTYKGRTTSRKALGGIAVESLDRWRAEIHPFEIHLTNLVARALFNARVYEPVVAEKHAAYPVRGERPGTYVANRMLLRYGI
jgi:protein-tyrosine sulfotransferase